MSVALRTQDSSHRRNYTARVWSLCTSRAEVNAAGPDGGNKAFGRGGR